ncbi:hypothetical protein [Bacillus sp. BP-3]|uniref:hypothetical protein n=1 Tax=Bacillus sp. BP-3 TaxID=3022773 RepID=UPI00232B80F6|nr:hypothetical protein [Bacillus sp. BP-3]MDC2867793.1 hypothetical protein [Bacillus sp. BP-3]
MKIQDQLEKENVKQALYEYALKATGKLKERFPENNMSKVERGVEPGLTRIELPSVTSSMNWGQGDVTIDIHHKNGLVKIYETEIDGENWSKSSLRLKGTQPLSTIIKEQEKRPNNNNQLEQSSENQDKVPKQQEINNHNSNQFIQEVKKEQTKEDYKQTYKEQILDDISPSKQEDRYKEQYKAELMMMLGIGNEKESDTNNQVSTKDKQNESKGQEERYVKSREERVKEMKEFEKTHSYPEVYRLKKESLQELKGLNLTDSQREKLTSIEKALDQEKQDYDKKNQKESKQGSEPKSQNKFSQLFHQFKNVRKKEQPKETGLERS